MALDILQSKNALDKLLLFIVIILHIWLRLHQFHSPSLFFPELSHFCIYHLSFFFISSFLSQGVLSPPLSTSPASESFCPSIMVVDIGFVKLLTSAFLFSPFFFKLMPPLLDDSIPPAF